MRNVLPASSILCLFFAAGWLGTGAWADGTASLKTGKQAIPAKVVAEAPAYYSLCLASSPKHNEQLTVNYIEVSLAEQRLYAYHGTMIISWSNISTGKAGHETPVGSFRVSQKDVDHHSNLYNNAAMPYFMRLTDGGVGMHAGPLPGYAASHGCIRLPYVMAQELYHHVAPGTPVEVFTGTPDFHLASIHTSATNGKA